MKKIITGFFMAWGNFCWIPCPRKIWDNDARKWMLAIMPIVGLMIGVLQMSIYSVFEFMGSKGYIADVYLIQAAVLTIATFFLSGFMHLDGYMDTCDAIFSRRDLKERQRILKDSKVGAFAVIMLVVLFLLYFSAMYEIVTNFFTWECLYAMIGVPFYARWVSSLGVLSTKPIETSQYSDLDREDNTQYKRFSIIMMIVVTVLYVWIGAMMFDKITEIIAGILFTVIGAFVSKKIAVNNLDGINGDIAGFSICYGELLGVLAIAMLG